MVRFEPEWELEVLEAHLPSGFRRDVREPDLVSPGAATADQVLLSTAIHQRPFRHHGSSSPSSGVASGSHTVAGSRVLTQHRRPRALTGSNGRPSGTRLRRRPRPVRTSAHCSSLSLEGSTNA